MDKVSMEAKLKHLEFIQNVITRMNSNSFSIKKWTITLVSAILVAAYNKNFNSMVLFISVPIIILFWWLDSFFLYQERLFRALYEEVALKEEEEINFTMDTQKFDYKNDSFLISNSIKSTFSSNTLKFLYGTILIIMIIISIVINLYTLKQSLFILGIILVISLITKSCFWFLINKK